MKRIFLAICLLLIFSTTTANAYTVFVGIDDTFDLTSVYGFKFNLSGITSDQLDLTIYYQGDVVGLCGGNGVGAVPGASTGPWYISPLSSNPDNVYLGLDGAVLAGGNLTPLNSGIILSLTSQGNTPFSLYDFILGGVNSDDFNIIETSVEGCIEGAKEYTFAAVPIPGSLVLLGSGLIGLIGLGRRRMRK